MKTFMYIFLIAGVLSVSCSKSGNKGYLPPTIVGHYVDSYMGATSGALTLYSTLSTLITERQLDVQDITQFEINLGKDYNNFIKDSFFPYPYPAYPDYLPKYRIQKYFALAKIYGDTLYNLEGYPGAPMFSPSPCLMDTISNIVITCNKDYDAKHLAGSSLNDIIRIEYCTPKSVIRSSAAEQKAFSHSSNSSTKRNGSYINITLDSFNRSADSNYLIGMGRVESDRVYPEQLGLTFKFISPPTYTDIYKFSVVMRLSNGMVFSFPNGSSTFWAWNGEVKLQGSK